MASRSVNKVILLGHLGKDAETKFTPSGTAVSNFTLATSRRWKDQQTGEWKEETEWHRIVLWRSENVSNYLLKGKQVYVEGPHADPQLRGQGRAEALHHRSGLRRADSARQRPR